MTTAIKINANDGKTRNVMSGSETTADFDFPIYASTHLDVYKTATDGTITLLVKDTDYTVPSGSVGVQAGGAINLTTPAVSGEIYTIYQSAAEERTTDFNQSGDFYANTLNQELDLLTQQVQQLRRDLSRAPLAAVDTTLTAFSLPTPADGYGLVWDGTSGTIRNTTSSIESLEDDAETVAGISADVTTVAGISSDVTTVSGIASNVTAVAGNSTNVNTIAGIDSDVTTVAGIAANVTTVAGISSNVTTVANNMTTITDAANNIPKANLIATTDPTVGDDTNDGYTGGSLWVNTSTDTIFFCADASAGAAQWQDISRNAVELALAALTPSANKIPYFTGADSSGLLDVLDEDNFASDSATGLPTQQSVKAYINNLNAVASEVISGVAGKTVTTDRLWEAMNYVTLTDAATIAIDFGTFINAKVTLGGNRTLGNPTSTKIGQRGAIALIQDGTGGRTIAFDSYWSGGDNVVLTTTPGAIDIIFYDVFHSGKIIITGFINDV